MHNVSAFAFISRMHLLLLVGPTEVENPFDFSCPLSKDDPSEYGFAGLDSKFDLLKLYSPVCIMHR